MNTVAITSGASDAQMNARVLRHMAVEASALLEEAQFAAAAESVKGESADAHAVQALTGAAYRLVEVAAWVSERMAWAGAPCEYAPSAIALGPSRPCEKPDSPALASLLERAERLYARAARLDELIYTPREAAPPASAPRRLTLVGAEA